MTKGMTSILGELKKEQLHQSEVLARLEKWQEETARETAFVESVVPLTGEEKKEISDKLSFLLGKDVEIRNLVNKKIIGGLRIKVASQIIDSSIKRQLERLKEELTK